MMIDVRGLVSDEIRVAASAAVAEPAIAETAAMATKLRRALRLMVLVMLVMSLFLSGWLFDVPAASVTAPRPA